MSRKILAGLLLALVAAAGCQVKPESKEAVRLAILEHLKMRPNIDLSQMDVKVLKVTFEGNHASADVTFHMKRGGDMSGTAMRYMLTRSGQTWIVDSRQPVGGHARTDLRQPGADPNEKDGTVTDPGVVSSPPQIQQ